MDHCREPRPRHQLSGICRWLALWAWRVNEIEKHPERLHEDFIVPVSAVVMAAWPCRKKIGARRTLVLCRCVSVTMRRRMANRRTLKTLSLWALAYGVM